jgi:hypothetical protein
LPRDVSRATVLRDPLFRCKTPECGKITCRDCRGHDGVSCDGTSLSSNSCIVARYCLEVDDKISEEESKLGRPMDEEERTASRIRIVEQTRGYEESDRVLKRYNKCPYRLRFSGLRFPRTSFCAAVHSSAVSDFLGHLSALPYIQCRFETGVSTEPLRLTKMKKKRI